MLEKGSPGGCYNIGGNNEKQNIDVVTLICDLLDEKVGMLAGGQSHRSLITYVTDRLGHDRRYAIDASRIKEEIGWEPSVTFEAGLEQTIDWYLDNQDWLQMVLDGTYQLDKE